MSTPFVGEIRPFAGNFAPVGWHFCDGSQQSISEYETLFSLIGTTYGGNGTTTFGLPDLRGRVGMSQGQGLGLTDRVLGQIFGTENVTLLQTQMPAHSHPYYASSADATANLPTGNVVAAAVPAGGNPQLFYSAFGSEGVATALDPHSIQSSGAGIPHENMMPTLALSYIIALYGIYPSQS
jgi:microcystin-dependent protein